MSIIPEPEKVYEDGRTKQAFVESCDINQVLKRAAVPGVRSHLERFGNEYGDYGDFDFLQTQLALKRGTDIWSALPPEVRREFRHEPQRFFDFVTDPTNAENLHELLPALAEPGTQMPRPGREPGTIDGPNTGPQAPRETVSPDPPAETE